MDKWQYKTFLMAITSEIDLVARLNQEGENGWELAAISLRLQPPPPQDEEVLPGFAGHNITGDYLVVLKKRVV